MNAPTIRFLIAVLSISCSGIQAATRTVCASGCDYVTINAAVAVTGPDDIISLTAGQTFAPVTLVGGGSTGHPAIIQTSDTAHLPPAGTRLTPAYTLGTTPVTAKIQSVGWGTQPAVARTVGASPAHDWILRGLELTDDPNATGTVYWIVGNTTGTTITSVTQYSHDIVIERSYVHGHRTTWTRKCIEMNGINLTVRDSTVDTCGDYGVDSQAIEVNDTPGPLTVVNNYLDSSTEVFSSGGARHSIQAQVTQNMRFYHNIFRRPDWYFHVSTSIAGQNSETFSQEPAWYMTSTWTPNHFVQAGKCIRSTTDNTDYFFAAQTTGTTGSTEPSWTKTPGATVVDGGVTWKTSGFKGMPWTNKNLWESKSSDGTDIAYNTFERSIGADTQYYAFAWTVRSYPGQGNPYTRLANTSLRNNTIRHIRGGMNILGMDHGFDSSASIKWQPGLLVEHYTYNSGSDNHSLGAVTPTTGVNGFMYKNLGTICTTDSTTEPVWATTIGATVVDGTCTLTAAQAAIPWVAGQTYANLAYVIPTLNMNGMYYQNLGASCTVGGSEPAWLFTAGATITDGGCTWTASAAASASVGIAMFGWSPGGTMGNAYNFHVRNNLWYDVSQDATSGFLQLLWAPQNIQIHNNTVQNSRTVSESIWGDSTYPATASLTDNIFSFGSYDYHGWDFQQANLLQGCKHITYLLCSPPTANPYPNNSTLCATAESFTRNIVSGATINAADATACTSSTTAHIPGGNWNTAAASIGYLNAAGNDFRLTPGSAYQKAGRNGASIGADISQVPLLNNLKVVTTDRAAVIHFNLTPVVAQQDCQLWVTTGHDLWNQAPIADNDPSLSVNPGVGSNDHFIADGLRRVMVVGLNTPLAASTTYYYTLSCGGAISDDDPYGASSFTTGPATTGTKTFTVSHMPETVGTTKYVVNYGTAYSRASGAITGGGSATATCAYQASGCTASFTVTRGVPTYYQILDEDAGSTVLASGPVQVAALR